MYAFVLRPCSAKRQATPHAHTRVPALPTNPNQRDNASVSNRLPAASYPAFVYMLPRAPSLLGCAEG